MTPTLTHAEIDAAGLRPGNVAGPRPSDPDILTDSPWNASLPLAARQAMWRARACATTTRLVAILAKRSEWTPAQVEAALSVALDIPAYGIDRRGNATPVDEVAIYRAAAAVSP